MEETTTPEVVTPEVVDVAPAVEPAVKPSTGNKTKGVCDIVFLIDATGSMQPAIDDLKRNIKMFFNQRAQGDDNGNAIVKGTCHWIS